MLILEELVRQGKISDLQSRAIKSIGLNNENSNLESILAQYSVSNEDILGARATAYNLNIIKVEDIGLDAADKITWDYAKENKILPIRIENGSLLIGMVDPEYHDIMNNLRLEMLKKGLPYKISIISENDFNNFIDTIPKILEKKNSNPLSVTKSDVANTVKPVLNSSVGNVSNIKDDNATYVNVNKEAESEKEKAEITNKIIEAQAKAVNETKKEDGVTFAGLVNQALRTEEPSNINSKDAKEDILSEDGLVDISDNDGDLARLESATDGTAVDEINTILKYSIDGGASDIHIEHAGEYTRIRIRVDGELKEIAAFGKSMHQMIVARVKILASLRLDEKRKPQDGRFSVIINSHKVDFRVSTMPGYYGEKIVMRILDSYRGIRKLEDIGFSARHLEQIRVALRKPYGMVLISGPTGSGKTTTLYSMLNEIDRKTKNVVSLEDPIEYNVPSMNQSQVFPEIGYTFASGLRSILRQDPDVIMVGEIRDAETAQLAVQAALTGHLVFSTIHTNNSIGVITRLMDMDVDPYLIAPTLNLAIAQRLTRQIVGGAADPIYDNPGIDKIIETQFADLPDEYKEILNLKRPMNNPKATADNPTGMKGRVPVLEILEVDKDIQKAIIEKSTEEKIWQIARAKGMINMKEDAIMKSMDGKVPFVEISNL